MNARTAGFLATAALFLPSYASAQIQPGVTRYQTSDTPGEESTYSMDEKGSRERLRQMLLDSVKNPIHEISYQKQEAVANQLGGGKEDGKKGGFFGFVDIIYAGMTFGTTTWKIETDYLTVFDRTQCGDRCRQNPIGNAIPYDHGRGGSYPVNLAIDTGILFFGRKMRQSDKKWLGVKWVKIGGHALPIARTVTNAFAIGANYGIGNGFRDHMQQVARRR